MRRFFSLTAAMVGLLVIADSAAALQDPPPGADSLANQQLRKPPQETQLVFEREVFLYPSFTRRNPFAALVGDNRGPRFEQIRLRGIIHAQQGSVALLGLGAAMNEQEQAQAGEGATNRAHRLRVGERLGNVRILEIRRTEILVEVEEFGLTEQRILRLPTRAQGES